MRSIADGESSWLLDKNVQSPVRHRIADIDTTFHPDATLGLMRHFHTRAIVALSLECHTTRRDAALAVANSHRPEVIGTPKAFLVEADTSPRNK